MRLPLLVVAFLAALTLAVPAAVGQSEGPVLTVKVHGDGHVTSDDDQIDCPDECTATYDGETVTLTAHPDSGNTFAGWSGDCDGTSTCVLEMDVSHDVKATFNPSCEGDCGDGNELTVEVDGEGHVTAGGGGGGGGGGGPPPLDIELAIDTTGSMGASIEQAQEDAKTLVTDVEAQFPGTLFAVVQFKDSFDTPEYELLQAMTSDADLIDAAIDTLSPSGGGDAPEAYNLVFQNSVTDSATGWRSNSRKLVIVIGDAEPHGAGTAGFAGCADTSADPHGLNTATVLASMKTNERTLIMVRQATTASTTLECYESLAKAAFDDGAAQDGGDDLIGVIEDLIGGVAPPPGGGGIDCPKDCSEVYFHEEHVTLQAKPSKGWVFDHWGGACEGTGACAVHMTKDRHVTAVFRPRSGPRPKPNPNPQPQSQPQQQQQTFGLSVQVTGDGSVASSPGGIDCSGGCDGQFAQGTKVVLVPFAHAGSTFVSWSGDCSGAGVCIVTLDGNKSVRATFTKQAPPTPPIGPVTNPINDRGIAGDLAQADLAFRCYAPKEVFLVKLFSDVLHRPIDQASLDLYFPRLAANQLTPAAAALSVLQSVEYRTQLVQGFYTALLHRPPTPAELTAALAQLGAGATDEQLEAAILGSPEYFGTRGGGTASGFLAALYGDVLGRPPTPAEQAAFDTALANGTTPGAFALQTLTSPEARARLVRAEFQAFLGRQPTEAELNAALARLAAWASDEQVAADILGSPEYSNRLPDYHASVSFGTGSSTDVDVRRTTPNGTICTVTARHRFDTPGNEPLTIEVTDPFGNTQSFRGFLRIVVAPPPPVGRENVQPFGTVLINVNGRFVPLTNFRQVRIGTELDTTRGRVRLTSHDGSTGLFFQGRFKILQTVETVAGRRKPFTLLLLTGDIRGICSSRTTSGVAAQRPPHKVIRRAWGNARGAFQTKGRYAAATVRGTLWQTVDYCDGTLVVVRRGRVDVLDLVRRVHHLVPAGRSFFIRAP